MIVVMEKQLIKLSCISCFIASFGDFIVMEILGLYYPGYNQMKNTMSSLGASISPVSNAMSVSWIIIGFLFILFGIGFYIAFKSKGQIAILASWLIILYGFGEGIGSGVFKANHINDLLTTGAMIHDVFGGFGIAAILFLPQCMKKVIGKTDLPHFYKMSSVVFYVGIFMLVLFSFRYITENTNFLNIYKGLWQRLMMLNTYIYLNTIAYIMFKKASTISKKDR
jgi:hypothetical protein